MPIVIVFSALFMLIGCSPASLGVIKVPVIENEPSPYIPPWPYLPIKDIKPTDNPDKIIKSLVASLRVCVGRNKALEEILEGYKND